jgi:hypothetical protein
LAGQRIIGAQEELMPNPLAAHVNKIQQARSQFETNEGRNIKPDKTTEWALLEICERLVGIQEMLVQVSQSFEKQMLTRNR